MLMTSTEWCFSLFLVFIFGLLLLLLLLLLLVDHHHHQLSTSFPSLFSHPLFERLYRQLWSINCSHWIIQANSPIHICIYKYKYTERVNDDRLIQIYVCVCLCVVCCAFVSTHYCCYVVLLLYFCCKSKNYLSIRFWHQPITITTTTKLTEIPIEW